MNKKQIIDKIVDDLPLSSELREMSNKEWYGWFEECWKKAINYTHCCTELPIKQYEIDFDGNVKVGINVTNNKIIIVGAINGYGNVINKEAIIITEI